MNFKDLKEETIGLANQTCCRCGIELTNDNWALNARKYTRNGNAKIWHICVDCFKQALANAAKYP